MKRYLTIKQAAEELGRSRPTVYKMIREGRLKVQRFAGKPVVAATEIERARPRKQEAGR